LVLPKQLVIFDIEGTLIDCVPQSLTCWREAFAACGYEFTRDQLHRHSGRDPDEMIRLLLPRPAADQLAEELKKTQGRCYRERYLPTVRPFPDVRALFTHIKRGGAITGLATTCSKAEMRHYCRVAEISELVDHTACGEDVAQEKPHPDLINLRWACGRAALPAPSLRPPDAPLSMPIRRRSFKRSKRFRELMSLSRKVKTALDENRLLILGAQILFGFQFQSVFQESFASLPAYARLLNSAALVLMALSVGLLIAPSMQHRIVERGQDTVRIHRVAGMFAGMATLPFGISLGLDVFLVFDHLFGTAVAAIAGGAFCALVALLWFALGFALRLSLKVPVMSEKEESPSLETQIEQMLTEARVIVPGAQALLGFQLAVAFTRAFEQLDAALRLIHVTALCFVAIAVVLLMTPAALHRIAFKGQDVEAFLKLGSGFVLTAPLALAAGLACDMQVAVAKALEATGWATTFAAASFVVLAGLWYGLPIFLRTTQRLSAP
jgi:phosphoglycolate phosphatase-like HAD superfamily hydrolase